MDEWPLVGDKTDRSSSKLRQLSCLFNMLLLFFFFFCLSFGGLLLPEKLLRNDILLHFIIHTTLPHFRWLYIAIPVSEENL